jgi:hypothetical protein
MLQLQAAYDEILSEVSGEVGHDELHTDNPEYDF